MEWTLKYTINIKPVVIGWTFFTIKTIKNLLLWRLMVLTTFRGNGLYSYADWHVERIEKLKRAGWNIINTPYYNWYLDGWLDQDHPTVKGEL